MCDTWERLTIDTDEINDGGAQKPGTATFAFCTVFTRRWRHRTHASARARVSLHTLETTAAGARTRGAVVEMTEFEAAGGLVVRMQPSSSG